MQLRYFLSYGQLAKSKNIFYFTCGNVWDKKLFLGYIDFMYSREGLDSKGFISSATGAGGNEALTVKNVQYFTTIANLDYRVCPLLICMQKVHTNWEMYIWHPRVWKKEGTEEAGTYNCVQNTILCQAATL